MKKIDIWALGVTIYSMVFNHLPFDDGKSEIDSYDKISKCAITYESRTIST